jgi:hypothetical protein
VFAHHDSEIREQLTTQVNPRGDASTVRDPWTTTVAGGYVCRARWSVPLLGRLADAYQNHRGFLLLGAGIVLTLTAVSTALGPRRHADIHGRLLWPRDRPAVTGHDGPVNEFLVV